MLGAPNLGGYATQGIQPTQLTLRESLEQQIEYHETQKVAAERALDLLSQHPELEQLLKLLQTIR